MLEFDPLGEPAKLVQLPGRGTASLEQTLIVSGRFFHPWVGDHYRTEGYGGKRLLLLGESHYHRAGGTDHPEMTRHIVFGLAIKGDNNGYSDRVLRLVTGASGPLSATQRADFWHQVAFCNFIQTGLAGPRVRPTKAMWAAAREPFLQTVQELEPQAILVLGLGVAWNLPPVPSGISVCHVKHPSSPGFSRKEWVPKVQAFLSATGNA